MINLWVFDDEDYVIRLGPRPGRAGGRPAGGRDGSECRENSHFHPALLLSRRAPRKVAKSWETYYAE